MSRTDLYDPTLVVGAKGFIGYHVTRCLHDAGVPVSILDPGPAPSPVTGLTEFNVSTADEDSVKKALKTCKRVIYLGGNSAPGAQAASMANDVEQEVATIVRFGELCAKAGCRQFIFASSAGTVYGAPQTETIAEDHPLHPISAYGAAKAATEHFLRLFPRSYDMDVLIFRISNPYGPGQIVKRNQGFIAAAMKAAKNGSGLEIWGDGSTTRDYIYIDDVAKAFRAALRRPTLSDTINISSGMGLTLNEICALVERSSKRSTPIHYAPARHVDIPRNVINNARAKSVLGWTPQTDIQTGLQNTWAWWDVQDDH